MGSNNPVIPAQLMEADLERVEGTLVTFRLIMFPEGARNSGCDTAYLSGFPQEEGRVPFHELLQDFGAKFGLLNAFMSIIEVE